MNDVSREWAERNAKHLPKIIAEHRRDAAKLKRLARHVERKAQQIEAIEALAKQD